MSYGRVTEPAEHGTRGAAYYLEAPMDLQPQREPMTEPAHETKRFRGWRLLGVILAVVVVLAVISAVVDYLVIGPLEGRI